VNRRPARTRPDLPAPSTTNGLDPHPLLATFFHALDDDEASWCVLRGTADLQMPAGDVDLLVAPADAPKVAAAADRVGFARLPARRRGSHVFYVAYDTADDLWLKLDVVSELAFGPGFELPSAAAQECLRRRRRVGDVATLAAADAFWSLLLHRMLDRGEIGAAAAELRELAADRGCADSPLAREVDALGAPACGAAALLDAARRGDWERLDALAPDLAAAWARARPAAVRRRRALARARRLAGPRVRWHRGLTVALLGPDGAGKSTAASALAGSFPIPVRTVYLSPARPQPRKAPPGVGLLLRLADLLGRWARGFGHRARGRLVVFDRYPYDALLPPRRPLGRLGRLRRAVLGRACPPPALTVVLDAPGALLHARKGEHDPEALEAERRGFLALARGRRHAVVLDAAQDADAVRRDLTAAIWAAYRLRWASHRLNIGGGAASPNGRGTHR
jgi:thymidylate kinase